MIYPMDYNPNRGRIRRYILDIIVAAAFIYASWWAVILAWAVLGDAV